MMMTTSLPFFMVQKVINNPTGVCYLKDNERLNETFSTLFFNLLLLVLLLLIAS